MSSFWWAGRKPRNTPPAPTSTLVTNGLYGSWKMMEGSGTTTTNEAGTRPLTLMTDSGTALPTWKTGGGISFPGPTSQLRRVSETAMDIGTGGVTLTIVVTPGTFTGVKSLIQRSGTNQGYVLQANKTANKIQISMGTGAARTTASIAPFTAGVRTTLCVSIPNDGTTAAVNIDGTETPFTPNTINWVNAGTSNLLIGYTFIGDIGYAAIHNRALNAQERANMVAYANSIMSTRP